MSDKDSKSDFVSIPRGLFIVYIMLAASLIPAFVVFIKWTPFFITIVSFPAVCLAVWWILGKKYTKHIKPVNKIIEAIIHDKPAFFPPKSVLVMYKNIKASGEKIVLIRKRMKKTIDYIAMLAYNKKDESTNDMISKQNEYYNYLFNYYDNYCSLYLDMRLQFYMTVIRDVLIAMKKIYKIDITHFIDTIKTDIKCMGYILRSKIHHKPNYSQVYSEKRFFEIIGRFEIITDIEQTIAFFFNDNDNTDKELKKQPSEKSENRKKYDRVLEKTNASIKAINRKIQEAAVYLITVQSNKLIGDTSPIDEENILNMQKKENNFNMILEHSKALDDEYDRFMAEMELMETNDFK
ncbi:MAG: hypothetical protein LBC60_03675 [Spirochaetaceae bacterium]|jgi:hypothetical protein|nr:hypothetical protein [Spirochaetaceae bacterium]